MLFYSIRLVLLRFENDKFYNISKIIIDINANILFKLKYVL